MTGPEAALLSSINWALAAFMFATGHTGIGAFCVFTGSLCWTSWVVKKRGVHNG